MAGCDLGLFPSPGWASLRPHIFDFRMMLSCLPPHAHIDREASLLAQPAKTAPKDPDPIDLKVYKIIGRAFSPLTPDGTNTRLPN